MHNIENKTSELLDKLFEKYRLSGQDTNDYLEGLLVSNYEPYWKYLHLDTLLSLQNTKTDFHDEMVFICYHQITELYFKLILHEIDAVQAEPENANRFAEAISRINRYMSQLINSFDIMVEGMLPEEFLKFRMALLPASGFQSYQFRLIEVCLTSLQNLVSKNDNTDIENQTLTELYSSIYWKKGAIDLKTNEKTLTLKQFEKQYDTQLLNRALHSEKLNLYAIYKNLQASGKVTEVITQAMKSLDTSINVNWRLAHYKSAVRYLQRADIDVPATGGTNWQKFLPPRFQKVVSFPQLWTSVEIENWGKSWVETHVFSK
ncbi:MAG: tryptophan 2,3-dioxygenase [Bacteroidia bacterium]|nr:tryptophan 2,3-dioxygenase [Bacteroidia bacterium]